MTVESIIGITSGLIGIGTFVALQWDKIKKRPVYDLLQQLVDTNLSPKEQKAILRQINKRLGGHQISEEYIQNFNLNNMKREAIFKDICLKNSIYPTSEICRRFLNADMKKFREEYDSLKPSTASEVSEVKSEQPSAPNNTEQTVYLSDKLMERYPETCKRLIGILEKHNTKYSFIKGTKDIWCRDYMPVKTETGQLIQFKYDPSYLKNTPEHIASRSDVDEIHSKNGIKAQKSEINLDGGNVLICGGRAIISSKVFTENPGKSEEEIKNELAKLLGCEIIIIPIINTDFTGHADGMVRFVDRNTILGNDLAAEYKYWREGMKKVLAEYNLSYIDVPFFEDKAHPKNPDSAIGVYVNYLEVNNLIVVPVFGHEKDKEAVAVIQKAFPDKIVETINYSDVALEGGLLNCTTWVV